MKSLKDSDSILKPKEKIIKQFTCADCKEKVIQKELIIPIGPRKGEAIVANFGCKCADIKLAKEAIKIRNKIKLDRLYKVFNNNSIINESLKTATFKTYNPTTTELGN